MTSIILAAIAFAIGYLVAHIRASHATIDRAQEIAFLLRSAATGKDWGFIIAMAARLELVGKLDR